MDWILLGKQFADLKWRVRDIFEICNQRYNKNHTQLRTASRLDDDLCVHLASELDAVICAYYPRNVHEVPGTGIRIIEVFYNLRGDYESDLPSHRFIRPYPKFLTDEQIDFIRITYEQFITFSDSVKANPIFSGNRYYINKYCTSICCRFDKLLRGKSPTLQWVRQRIISSDE